MIQRDFPREPAAEILWTCRRQGHVGRLLSKSPFDHRIHQVMLTSHVRKIQSNRPTRRCLHRIWASIRGGYRTHCFPGWQSSANSCRRETILLQDREQRETSKQFHYEKARERERESTEVGQRVGHQPEEEWTKWQKFVAGRPCRDEDLQLLLDEGPVVLPTDVDRAAHVRREREATLCGRNTRVACVEEAFSRR